MLFGRAQVVIPDSHTNNKFCWLCQQPILYIDGDNKIEVQCLVAVHSGSDNTIFLQTPYKASLPGRSSTYTANSSVHQREEYPDTEPAGRSSTGAVHGYI